MGQSCLSKSWPRFKLVCNITPVLSAVTVLKFTSSRFLCKFPSKIRTYLAFTMYILICTYIAVPSGTYISMMYWQWPICKTNWHLCIHHHQNMHYINAGLTLEGGVHVVDLFCLPPHTQKLQSCIQANFIHMRKQSTAPHGMYTLKHCHGMHTLKHVNAYAQLWHSSRSCETVVVNREATAS